MKNAKHFLLAVLVLGLCVYMIVNTEKRSPIDAKAVKPKSVVSDNITNTLPVSSLDIESPGKPLVEYIKDFRKRGVNLEQSISGKTYLIRAIQTNNVEAVKELLAAGVSANTVDPENNIPPIFFAIQPKMKFPKLKEPDPDAPEEEIQKYYGLEAGKKELDKSNTIFNLLIAAGADVNVFSQSSESLLHAAIRHGRKDLVIKLLTMDADKYAYAKRFDMTPLMYAAYYGNWQIAQVLIKAGVDIHDVSDKGETALSLAEKRTFPEKDQELFPFFNYDKTITLLKQHGAR